MPLHFVPIKKAPRLINSFMRSFLWSLWTCCTVQGRVWFLRHCDKPHENSSPCCSAKGIRRMTHWGQFIKAYMSDNATVQIMTALDSTIEVCSVDREPPNPVCQSSARFHESSRYVQKALQISTHLEERLCIGQSEILAQRINATKGQYSDTIVVWEHRDMVRVLWHLGQPLSPWPTNRRYDIVFVLEAQTLAYRSVRFEGEHLVSPLHVAHWLRETKEWQPRNNNRLTEWKPPYEGHILWKPDERPILPLYAPFQQVRGQTYPSEEKVTIIVTIFLATMAVIIISVCISLSVMVMMSKYILRPAKRERPTTYGTLDPLEQA